ncbi:AMP nucleosidase [Escherichia coli]|nr:AMP nucleosidase [Escherichia coli]
MLPSEIMIWQPEFTDKTLSRKPGAVHTLVFLMPVAFLQITDS